MTAAPAFLRSITGAALELGVDRRVVAFLIERLGIATHKVPMAGTARGIDEAGFAQLKGATAPLPR
jgi:hypothetical protein